MHSTFALVSGDFRYAGELMASSIIQGGPAPNFLARWVYMFITGGLDNVELCESHIKEENLRDIVDTVRRCLIWFVVLFCFMVSTISRYSAFFAILC